MTKIGIIGLGHVGAHVASAIIQHNLATDLYLFDLNQEKLIAEKKDLEQAALLEDATPVIHQANLVDLLQCDFVVNTASKPIMGGDRLKELAGTKAIVEEIFKDFNSDTFKGIIINVSNPCDVVTYLIQKVTKLDSRRVIGTGTLLDTLRMQSVLSQDLKVAPKNINALVIGEHGESQVNVYSQTLIYNASLAEFLKANKLALDYAKIDEETRYAGWAIFKVKNATEYGIGSVTAYLIKQILQNSNIILPYSHPYIYKNQLIYTSYPAYLNSCGYNGDFRVELDEREQELFAKSNEVLLEVINGLNK